MTAYTPHGYLHSFRNKMDLVVTVLGCVWIVLHQSFGSQSEFVIIFGYSSIILRFLTITGKHATLSMLMQTVAVSVRILTSDWSLDKSCDLYAYL